MDFLNLTGGWTSINLMAVYIADIMALTLLATLGFCCRNSILNTTREDLKAVRDMYIVDLIGIFFDFIAYNADGVPGSFARMLVIWSNMVVFTCTIFSAAYWVVFIKYHLYGSSYKVQRQNRIILGLAGVVSATTLVDLFYPLYFTLDENNVYSRTPMVAVFVGFVAIFVLYSLYDYFKFSRMKNQVRFFPIGVFLIPVSIAYITQMLFTYGISLGWPALAIAITGVAMSLQREIAYVDGLTDLLNRTYLYNSSIYMQMHGAILLDLNNFKPINDLYGHSEGDRALQTVAGILQIVVVDFGIAVRYAGDEFMVFCRAREQNVLEDVADRINQELTEYNVRSKKPYELTVSMGMSVFDPEKMPLDKLFKMLDEYMYEDKQRFYELHPEFTRRH